jgi:N-acyl-D-amino-acid deacylase
MDADLLIRGGTVVDGTGRPPFRADLLIRNGRIHELGLFPQSMPWAELDAQGLYVTPGFIDVHSHSDFTVYVDPRAVSSITQGVTLEIVGNCGHGCAPIVDPEIAKINIYGYHSAYPIQWRTLAQYLEALEVQKPAINVATLVPNGNLRLATVGLEDRPANTDEIRKMHRLLKQGLEEGALGFSTGLEYGTERGATEEEISDLCRIVAKAEGVYATHTRNDFGQARETIEEAIRTGEAAGVPLQISHIGIVARLADDPRPAVEQALAQVEAARARGMKVAFDMHTRDYGITNLSAVLPPWVMEGGKSSLEKRLQDPQIRKELKAYPNIVVAEAQGRWDKILLFECKAHPELSRRSIGEIAASRSIDPLDAIYDILLGEIDTLHEVLIIERIYDESDLRLPFDHPCCMVGSDATALATDGPLGGRCFHGAYTWASWFLRHFVHESKRLALEEAIRRLTSLPAETFGIRDRGVIRKRAWADLAIFDPLRLRERGTVFEPNQISEGVVHVLVNGSLTLKDGLITGQRAGRVIRRGSQS